MLHWFHTHSVKSNTGLPKIRTDFSEMLQKANTEFLLACQVALHGTVADAVREETTQLDKAINKLERQIRKELVVHCSVRGVIDPECLVMMSIAKDAERLGDYAKNIFDMGELAPSMPEGKEQEELLILEQFILKLFKECMNVLQSEDEEAAKKVIIDCKWAERQCDAITNELLNLEVPTRRTASDVLMFRFMKRIMSHLRNISSSVVQPLHKLDFTKKITKSAEMGGTLLDRKAELGIQ